MATPRPQRPKTKRKLSSLLPFNHRSFTGPVDSWIIDATQLKIPFSFFIVTPIVVSAACVLALYFGIFQRGFFDKLDWSGLKNGPNNRGTLNVIWTCLSTIFSCVYVAMHFDVPSRKDSKFVKFSGKWIIVLFGMAAPEVFLGRSCYQFVRSWKSVKAVAAAGLVGGQGRNKWTMTHAMFTEMKGFERSLNGKLETVDLEFMNTVLCDKESIERVELSQQLDRLLEEISDKSKADPMVKVLACLQVMWFLIIILARRFGTPRLPLTQLEIATCGYIICALGTWSFWMYKPYNVQYPITLPTLPVVDSMMVQSPASMISSDLKWSRISRATDNTVCEESRDSAAILSDLKFDAQNSPAMESAIVNETPLDTKEISESPRNSSRLDYFYPTTLKKSPDHEAAGGDLVGVTMKTDPEAMKIGCVAMFFGAAVYGACHLFAWDFVFHTPSGQLLWRICSVTILVFSMTHISLVYFLQTERARRWKLVDKVWFKVILFSVGPIYGSARAVLMILVFVAFLNVPPAVYNQIKWAGVIPRIG